MNQASMVLGGTATLSILDDAGVQVYSADIAPIGSFQTASGAAGTWTVRVALSDLYGALNFGIQKSG